VIRLIRITICLIADTFYWIHYAAFFRVNLQLGDLDDEQLWDGTEDH